MFVWCMVESSDEIDDSWLDTRRTWNRRQDHSHSKWNRTMTAIHMTIMRLLYDVKRGNCPRRFQFSRLADPSRHLWSRGAVCVTVKISLYFTWIICHLSWCQTTNKSELHLYCSFQVCKAGIFHSAFYSRAEWTQLALCIIFMWEQENPSLWISHPLNNSTLCLHTSDNEQMRMRTSTHNEVSPGTR